MVGLCWPALSVVNHCLLSTLHMNTPYCIVPESLLAHTVAGLSITATQTLSSVAASRFPYFNSWVLFTFSNKEKKKKKKTTYLFNFILFIHFLVLFLAIPPTLRDSDLFNFNQYLVDLLKTDEVDY